MFGTWHLVISGYRSSALPSWAGAATVSLRAALQRPPAGRYAVRGLRLAAPNSAPARQLDANPVHK
jgi:hypothetical protein